MKSDKRIILVFGAFLFVIGLLAEAETALAESVTDQPHILSIFGHSSSVTWDAARGKYLPTCDYKFLDGSAPVIGDGCDGTPRVSFTTEDLQNLVYVSQADDLFDLVKRVYERFPKILIITSPDFSVDYKNSPYAKDSQVLNLRQLLPQGVDIETYDYLASRARAVLLTNGTRLHKTTVGTVVDPFANIEPLGGTLHQGNRVLSDFSLVFLYKNPDRTTLIHELIHCLINRGQERAIISQNRYQELGQNDGKFSFLSQLFYGENFDESSYEPKELANLDLMYLEYHLENRAASSPEELEVAYFLSKYGKELGIPSYAIADHQNNFWKYVEQYKEDLLSFSDVIQGYAPESTVNPINSNASHIINGKLIPNYFRDYWNKLQIIAQSYPKNLLGDELRVNRSNPRTIIDHFVVDIGPRNSTTAQR